MKKTIFLFSVIALATAFLAQGKSPLSTATQKPMSAENKLRYAEAIIENFYVDTIDAEHMVEEGIKAMLLTLDPHSSYSNAKETEDLNTPLQGKFSGIGIQFNMIKDTLFVIQTTSGGPSEKVGIQSGDRILKANDSLISGAGRLNSDILNILRGPKGTKVNLNVKRGNELIDFLVIRDDIPLYSVGAAYMADPETGYIRITRFAEDTAEEVFNAMNKLKGQGMKKVIIDLEDNGGGYLGSAYQLAELFLQKDDPIVFTKGLNAAPSSYKAERTGPFADLPLVVMVNQNSASASEIFSGAMQDNDRGVIIGRRTFGKGLVQRPFPFPDGSMIRLTTAYYYTPTGRSIQKPFERGHRDDYQMDIVNRFNAGELMHADSVHLDSTKIYKTLRYDRTVYGGGGIMPDVFVPLDTTLNSKYYRTLTAKNVFGPFVVSNLDKNRSELLAQYPTEEDFYANFTVSPEFLDEFVKYGEAEGVELVPDELERSKELITTVIKALMQRDLYEDGCYYRVSNHLDPIFNEAVILINDPARYNSLLKPDK